MAFNSIPKKTVYRILDGRNGLWLTHDCGFSGIEPDSACRFANAPNPEDLEWIWSEAEAIGAEPRLVAFHVDEYWVSAGLLEKCP